LERNPNQIVLVLSAFNYNLREALVTSDTPGQTVSDRLGVDESAAIIELYIVSIRE